MAKDRICPNWKECNRNHCPGNHHIPHKQTIRCDVKCLHGTAPCIVIPEKFLDEEEISCPHVGESGGCDDCQLGLEPMTCQEELTGGI